MKIAYFNTFTPEYTLEESCAMAKKLGYEGIQPRIVNAAPFDPSKPLNPWGNNKGTITEDAFIKNPKEALKPIYKSGLKMASFPSYCGVNDLKRAKNLIRACGEVGIKAMRLGPMPLPKAEPGKLVNINGLIKESQKQFKNIIKESKAAGVRLCLELHMGALGHSPSAALRIIEGFDPKLIGILYDPGNMVYEGHEPPRISISAMGPYLAEVHVKNSKWSYDKTKPVGQRYFPEASDLADGVVDWKAVIDTLKAAKFNGWLIEEAHNHGVPSQKRLEINIKYIKQWLKG